MVDVTAKVICDSIGEHSPRLTTFLTRYPKWVHAEHMRHRTGSYCVSSSRAVPVSKNLEEVRSDALRAGPVYWASEQKGMQGGEELDDAEPFDPAPERPEFENEGLTRREYARRIWARSAFIASTAAAEMSRIGVHKSIVNRLLEPFLHVNMLVTSCEPGLLNFFGLRLDRAAQPEIRALAEAMWAAWNESEPNMLQSGQWHLPFIELQADLDAIEEMDKQFVLDGNDMEDVLKKISVARCARLSYTSFETGRRSTIEEDLKLYDRLITSRPIHASPAEHQATPDVCIPFTRKIIEDGRKADLSGLPHETDDEFRDRILNHARYKMQWSHPELHGNLPGWVQLRKTLPGEAVAELPEGYAR